MKKLEVPPGRPYLENVIVNRSITTKKYLPNSEHVLVYDPKCHSLKTMLYNILILLAVCQVQTIVTDKRGIHINIFLISPGKHVMGTR